MGETTIRHPQVQTGTAWPTILLLSHVEKLLGSSTDFFQMFSNPLLGLALTKPQV
jgi:hypothetical protein